MVVIIAWQPRRAALTSQ